MSYNRKIRKISSHLEHELKHNVYTKNKNNRYIFELDKTDSPLVLTSFNNNVF